MEEARTLDLPFYPYDDVSYHNIEKDKNGIRCVAVVPNDYVRTMYVQRSFSNICERISKGTGCTMDQIYSQDLVYSSGGQSRTLTVIYTQAKDRLPCCIRYEGEPLIFADGCLIAGENFSDLSLDQCYGIVMSARAMKMNGTAYVSVDIRKDMDTIPRLVSNEE